MELTQCLLCLVGMMRNTRTAPRREIDWRWRLGELALARKTRTRTKSEEVIRVYLSRRSAQPPPLGIALNAKLFTFFSRVILRTRSIVVSKAGIESCYRQRDSIYFIYCWYLCQLGECERHIARMVYDRSSSSPGIESKYKTKCRIISRLQSKWKSYVLYSSLSRDPRSRDFIIPSRHNRVVEVTLARSFKAASLHAATLF